MLRLLNEFHIGHTNFKTIQSRSRLFSGFPCISIVIQATRFYSGFVSMYLIPAHPVGMQLLSSLAFLSECLDPRLKLH